MASPFLPKEVSENMAHSPNKCDPELGRQVEDLLRSKGLHTPTVTLSSTPLDRIERIRDNMTEIMGHLGLDLSDDSLADTPNRVAKMWVNELMWGLEPLKFPKCTAIENKMHYDEMLSISNIKVMSLCEHHFVTIDGTATVAYIPKNKVIGLSKINRVVEYFSRRPQVQERLTAQIMETLKHVLETEDVAVSINAKHYCVISRGVEDTGSYTVSNALSGSFRDDPETRKEFLSMIKV
jgi:GTP cyclohydrolase I